MRFFFAQVIEAFFFYIFTDIFHIIVGNRQQQQQAIEKKGQSIPQKKELCECIANADFFYLEKV